MHLKPCQFLRLFIFWLVVPTVTLNKEHSFFPKHYALTSAGAMNMTTLVLLLTSKLTPLPPIIQSITLYLFIFFYSQYCIHLFVMRSFSLPFDIVLNVYLDSNLQLCCDIATFA